MLHDHNEHDMNGMFAQVYCAKLMLNALNSWGGTFLLKLTEIVGVVN